MSRATRGTKPGALSKEFSELAKLLSAEELARAMLGGIRREANRVKKKAQDNAMTAVASHGLHVDERFRKGIRAISPRNLTGFVVTPVPPRKKKGGADVSRYYYPVTRKSKKRVTTFLKPILLWSDEGMRARYTVKGWFRGRMMSHKGGPLKFMAATENAEMNTTQANISKGIYNRIIRIARKKRLL